MAGFVFALNRKALEREIMKKSILTFGLITFTVVIAFCQNNEVVIQNELNTASSKSSNSSLFRTYYFKGTVVDSSIFAKDSIVLYKNRINQTNAKLELYNDSKFQLLYNIKLTTQTKINFDTGERSTVTVQNNDEIEGTYNLMKIESEPDKTKDEFLKLMLKDGKIYNYDILDVDEQYILIKE